MADGASIVAGISVLVAGATSIAAPMIAGKNQLRADAARLGRERALRDRDEVRALVDEAALAAPTVIQAQAALRGAHNTADDPSDVVPLQPHIKRFLECREDMIHLDTPLILRLGYEHPVRQALATFVNSLDGGTAVIASVTLAQPREPNFLEISVAERAAMHEARERFLVAAAEWMQAEPADV